MRARLGELRRKPHDLDVRFDRQEDGLDPGALEALDREHHLDEVVAAVVPRDEGAVGLQHARELHGLERRQLLLGRRSPAS